MCGATSDDLFPAVTSDTTAQTAPRMWLLHGVKKRGINVEVVVGTATAKLHAHCATQRVVSHSRHVIRYHGLHIQFAASQTLLIDTALADLPKDRVVSIPFARRT